MEDKKKPWNGVPEQPEITRYHWVRHHGGIMSVPHLWIAPPGVWDDPALADTIAPADFASICDYEGPVDTPDEVKALRSRLAMFVENLVGHQEALQNAGWEIVALRRALGLNPAAISAGWIEAMEALKHDIERSLAAHMEAEEENARLKAALRPFAEAAEAVDEDVRNEADMWESPAAMALTAGDFRRARALLFPNPTETP